MISKIWIFLVLVVLATAVVAVFYFWLKEGRELVADNSNLVKARIKDQILFLEIADNPIEKAKGLSGRSSLAENRGMLFVFDEPGYYVFWMLNMKFPLDIVWLGENYEVVDISQNVSPDTFPKSFKPAKPAKYVLEINAGLADKIKIKKNDILEIWE